MSEDYKKEIDRLIKIAGVKAVNRISDPIRVEDAFQPKKRKTLKETIKVIADTPEEAQAFMALLQNAGIEQEMPQGDEMEPGDELPQAQGDELPQDGGPPCGMEAEAEGEIAQGADYANSPDEEYEDDPMNTYSTKWNHQKKFRRTNNHGDNPLSLADSLMREWTDVRDTKETEEVINPRIKERQVGEEEAMAQYSPNLPKDKKTKEDVINEMGDAETELLPGVKDEDNILIVQRGDNADDIDEDPRVIGELYASEKHSDDDIKKAIADYLKSKNLDTNFYYDSTPNDYYSKEKTVDGRPFRAEVSLHWLGNMGESVEEEAIDPVWGDWGYTPESWSDAKVEDNADYIIAMSKGQAPDIGSWDSTFDSLQDGLPDMDIEGSKYDPNDIIEMLDDTIGGKVTYVVGQYLQEKEDTGELGPPSPEVQKAALEVVNNPEFKKAVSRVRSGQQEQVGDEELNRIKELSRIDKQVGEEELKRYGNYRRRN